MLMLEWRRFKPTRPHNRIDIGILSPWCHSSDEFVDGGTIVDYDVEVVGELGPFFGLVFGVIAAYVKDCWECFAHREDRGGGLNARVRCTIVGGFAPHEGSPSATSSEILATAEPIGGHHHKAPMTIIRYESKGNEILLTCRNVMVQSV